MRLNLLDFKLFQKIGQSLVFRMDFTFIHPLVYNFAKISENAIIQISNSISGKILEATFWI